MTDDLFTQLNTILDERAQARGDLLASQQEVADLKSALREICADLPAKPSERNKSYYWQLHAQRLQDIACQALADSTFSHD